MKKTLSSLAVGLLVLAGCSQQPEEPAASPTPSATLAPAAESIPAPTPDELVVTYRATATYPDGTDAPFSLFWSDSFREYGDASSSWEESVTSLGSGDYAQVLATPSEAGVDISCEILVNGEMVHSDAVQGSEGRALCEYTLP